MEADHCGGETGDITGIGSHKYDFLISKASSKLSLSSLHLCQQLLPAKLRLSIVPTPLDMSAANKETVVQQGTYLVPDFTVKQLLEVVPYVSIGF